VQQYQCGTINRSVSTVLANSTAFLYSGSNPIQTGVAAGTILPASAAVIRGHVYLQSGAALPGVTVTIANHPEFGTTLTQADGSYDVAVNGGQRLLVNYALTGYFPAQRTLEVPWQDYIVAKDVVLLQPDPNVTAITLGNSSFQVAQGSVESDSSGTRQATVLIPPDTAATMTSASGTTTPTTLHVRATEYTVGPNGPSAMPGDLPPASAYTYAVGLTADEAISANASSLTFSQPLPVYLQDFINLPAGTTIPAGSYGSGCCGGTGGCATWVPSTSGIALQIVSITGGQANVDVTGDGVADTGSELTNLGITSAELTELATLYSVGQFLWRIPVPHFTVWDFNLGPADVPDAGPPPPPIPPPPPPGPQGCQDDGGSSISCQQQSLGEAVAVAGTSYTLHYDSDRQVGREPSLVVPLSGSTLPGPVGQIELDVTVAGQTFTQYFAPQTNLTTTFAWNGTDAFGRLVQGEQPITVQASNLYLASYAEASTFGQWGIGTSVIEPANDIPLNNVGPLQLAKNPGWASTWTGTIGIWDNMPVGLGGWSLSVHHAYDPGAHTIHFGDGTDLTPAFLPNVITTIAGNGGAGLGNGGPATAAGTTPYSVVVGPDGTIYIGDGFSCIRSVNPSTGIIETYAGQCNNAGYAGDGGPATSALMRTPEDMVFGCDGSLYFADELNNRIRRISPSGVITTVVGMGVEGSEPFAGDGGPATSANLYQPTSLDFAPDGTMFIADSGHDAVRRVTPDGIITTVAGNGVSPGQGLGNYPFQNGVPATQTFLKPGVVRVQADGSLLIADESGGTEQVRRVTTDGIIHLFYSTSPSAIGGMALAKDGSVYITYAGIVQRITTNGSVGTIVGPGTPNVLGDNGPAAAAGLGTTGGLFVSSNGTLYIADPGVSRLRMVGPPLAGFTSTSAAFSFASTDGTQVYTFNGSGQHLQTINALTQAVLYQFAYDSSGRLSSVTDAFGNVTQINRDGSGNPLSIVGPYGETTMLAVDSNGTWRASPTPWVTRRRAHTTRRA
jgi:YD repeat-containing protein